MSKDWNVARNQLKDALYRQEQYLKQHRENLSRFEKARDSITEFTSDAVADMLEQAIAEETRRVKSIETNIRDIQRDLRGKYSLAVA